VIAGQTVRLPVPLGIRAILGLPDILVQPGTPALPQLLLDRLAPPDILEILVPQAP